MTKKTRKRTVRAAGKLHLDRDKILWILRYAAGSLTRDYLPDTVERFVADALDRYLMGEATTLDQAFGLSQQRGARTKNRARDIEIATKVLRFKRSRAKANRSRGAVKKFLLSICDEYGIKSGRNIMGIADRYKTEAEDALKAERIYKRRNKYMQQYGQKRQ